METQSLQLVQQWGDCGQQAGRLGIEDYPQGASQVNAQTCSDLAGKTIVQYCNRSGNLKAQREHLSLSSAEISHQGEHRAARGLENPNPIQSRKIWKAHAALTSDTQLFNDGRRYRDNTG